MLLSALVTSLRLDLDESDETLGNATAKRMIEKALVRLNADLGTSYQVSGTEGNEVVSPEPTSEHRELLLILAAWFWSLTQRNRTAKKVFSWKSGDKIVNRISLASNYKELGDALIAAYREGAGLDKDPAVEGRVAEIGTGDEIGAEAV